jgi:hypothetical protein
MFNGSFKEATDRSASFPEDESIIWNFYIKWLYTRNLKSLGLDNRRNGSQKKVSECLKLVLFAEKYDIESLVDFSINIFARSFGERAVTERPSSISAIEYAYTKPKRALLSENL